MGGHNEKLERLQRDLSAEQAKLNGLTAKTADKTAEVKSKIETLNKHISEAERLEKVLDKLVEEHSVS